MKRIKKSLDRLDFAFFHKTHSREPESELLNEILNPDPRILQEAKEGNSFAQLDVGKLYCSTSKLNGNLKLAFHWFTLSAGQGNMEAQFRLGDMYALGDGTEKNEFIAYDWYLKSALQGYPKALTRLHNLYHTEKSMYCRGQRNSKEEKWTTADFKKENNIRELYEYRVQQLGSELTNTKEYFTQLLTSCREQINDDEVENEKDAYLKLGFLYQHGYGIRKIKTRAIEFYRLAAEKGSADAAYNLGYIFRHSSKMKWNYLESFKWYTIATEKGQIYAHNGLAFLYLKGLGTNIDYSLAINLYTKAAENRNVNAMISLARIFRLGGIIEQDHKKAAEWYKRAAVEGSTVAQSSLELLNVNKLLVLTETDMHLTNESQKKYSKKGLCSKLRSDISTLTNSTDIENIKKLATNAMRRDAYAMLEIGMKYYNGNDFAQDKDTAFKWIRNASKSGIATIQSILAKLYKDGDCVEQNYHKASIWYEKAAKQGDPDAQYSLGLLYYHGISVRKDQLEASRWYTFAANKNNSDAQCQLGILRENGEGLRQDLPEALQWFNISVKQKNPQAIYRLARMYENGALEKRDFQKALVLYEKAAQLGSIDAQIKLASIYGKKKSQQYDEKTAFKYHEMAANQGSPEAKFNLATMYLNGKGVSKDFIQAYRLFKESSNLGYENAINIFNIPIDYSKTSAINYHKIGQMFRLICKNGIDSLEYNLGYHYSNSTYKNEVLNYAWLLKAARKYVPEAHYELAVIHEKKNDPFRAMRYYKKAHKLGSTDAGYRLACMYLDVYGVFQNFQNVFILFSEASDRGDIEAYKVLNHLENGDSNIKNDLIQKMFEVSAQSGNVISQYKVGVLALEEGKSAQHIQKAIKWLYKASKGGYIEASYRLAFLLENTVEIEKDYQEIIRLYQNAADKGHEEASFRLAQLYHFGDKLERDYLKAYIFYSLAAQQGYKPAQLAIKVTTKTIWEDNKSQLKDESKKSYLSYEACLHMWEQVAEEGDSELQYKLGVVYEKNGGNSNMVQAVKWYSKATRGFHDGALYNLGRLYETGQGATQDYTKAIKLYESASGLHNSQALYQLGVIYQDGKGVKPDLKMAHYYYVKATEKRNNAAQLALGKLYEDNKFISQDILKALKWFSLSASQGNKDAENWLNTRYDEAYDNNRFYHRKLSILSRIIKFSCNSNQLDDSLLASANYELGIMHHYGYGTPVDYKKAWKYYWIASETYGYSKARKMLTIKYKNIDISIKNDYLKKLEMLELSAGQLSAEDVYELGSIYHHGVYSYSKDDQADKTELIVKRDQHKSDKYFIMILKRELPEIETPNYFMYCSYYLGMIHFVDSKNTKDSQYYFKNAVKCGSFDSQAFLHYSDDKKADGLGEATLFEKVFEWHIKNQNTTDIKLLYNLGRMYDEGLGTQRDYEKAIHYYNTVANLKLERVDEIETNYTISVQWDIKLADQKRIVANYNLGNIYFYGKGAEKDYTIAFRCYKTAADQGHRDSQAQIGCLYEKGYGVEQNLTIAIEWYIKAANQRHPTANYNLGRIYYYGMGVKKDYGLAFQYYKAAADLRHSDSQNSLGSMYENGEGVEQNYEIAIEWYIKAANQKHPTANCSSGRMYYSGKGVKKDYALAFQYYKTAADLGHSISQNTLGIMYENGYGVEQNLTIAIEWFTKAASQKYPPASYYLGRMHYWGKGVKKDYALAFQYYKAAADLGFSYSQNNLGAMYEFGEGIEQNYEIAIQWYTKAANQKSPIANYNLGRMYFYGHGVKINYDLAFQYCKAAADQGHGDAQDLLTLLHDVRTSKVLQNFWLGRPLHTSENEI